MLGGAITAAANIEITGMRRRKFITGLFLSK
jgi:hypothetical protein